MMTRFEGKLWLNNNIWPKKERRLELKKGCVKTVMKSGRNEERSK